MTTNERHPETNGDMADDEILAASDRVALNRVRASRAIRRGRLRRRILPKVAAVTAVLATLAIADTFVQAAVPRPSAVTLVSSGTGSSSTTAAALAQVARTLAADQRALAALAKAQANLAKGASGDNGSGAGVSASSIQLPSLSPVASLPTLSAPAPVVAVTTGASVVVP